jgi:hypothetical protein
VSELLKAVGLLIKNKAIPKTTTAADRKINNRFTFHPLNLISPWLMKVRNRTANEKASEEKEKSPQRLHIGTFQQLHSIRNSGRVKGKL